MTYKTKHVTSNPLHKTHSLPPKILKTDNFAFYLRQFASFDTLTHLDLLFVIVLILNGKILGGNE